MLSTFKEARKQLIDSYLNDIIDDEEFVLLYDAHFSKNPEFPYKEYERFAMGDIDNVEFEAKFRVRKEDIPTLAEVLTIPDSFVCPQGTKADGIEGLCCVLKRFAYLCRYSDRIPLFGRTVPEYKHDQQRCCGLYLQPTWSQALAME